MFSRHKSCWYTLRCWFWRQPLDLNGWRLPLATICDLSMPSFADVQLHVLPASKSDGGKGFCCNFRGLHNRQQFLLQSSTDGAASGMFSRVLLATIVGCGRSHWWGVLFQHTKKKDRFDWVPMWMAQWCTHPLGTHCSIPHNKSQDGNHPRT